MPSVVSWGLVSPCTNIRWNPASTAYLPWRWPYLSMPPLTSLLIKHPYPAFAPQRNTPRMVFFSLRSRWSSKTQTLQEYQSSAAVSSYSGIHAGVCWLWGARWHAPCTHVTGEVQIALTSFPHNGCQQLYSALACIQNPSLHANSAGRTLVYHSYTAITCKLFGVLAGGSFEIKSFVQYWKCLFNLPNVHTWQLARFLTSLSCIVFTSSLLEFESPMIYNICWGN